MLYLIKNTLVPSEEPEKDIPLLYIITPEEWLNSSLFADSDINRQLVINKIMVSRAVVNSDTLSGSFWIPSRTDRDLAPSEFYYILNQKQLVIIDSTGFAEKITGRIQETRKWKHPSIGRFLYDFLEEIIEEDIYLIAGLEKELNEIEEQILKEEETSYSFRINEIRGYMLDLRTHYSQLADLSQELEENENGFFSKADSARFRMFTERILRLQDMVTSMREYTVQLRDLIQSQLSERQNNIMTILTIVTTIFTPLTLITGWFGMNFRYMPELNAPYAYPIVILISVSIAVGCLTYFKKKKWI